MNHEGIETSTVSTKAFKMGLWASRINVTGNLLERQNLGPQFRALNQMLWDEPLLLPLKKLPR